MQNGSQRMPGVDVLRGLAAILVVLHHIHLRFQIQRFEVRDLLPDFLERILFWSGYYAVIAFFVISGFLITRLSMRRWESLERVQVMQFYRLRAARILPCLLALLAVLSVLHLLALTDYTIKPERGTLARALLAALTFHVNWLEGHRGYLPGNWDVLWSLSVEETFYALFPLFCVFLKREKLLLPCLLALIVIAPFNRVALEGQTPWNEYAYLSCMDGIAFGCIAGWISTRVSLSRRSATGALSIGLAAISLIVVFRGQLADLRLSAFGLDVTTLELGTALLLIAFANGAGSVLAHRGAALLRLAGRCSYEIYLTHMFIVFGSMQVFKALSSAAPTTKLPYFTAYAVMLVLSVLLGYAIERWYSEPLNRRLREKWEPRRLAAQPASATEPV